jgi:pyridoxine 4-dehydrogenase
MDGMYPDLLLILLSREGALEVLKRSPVMLPIPGTGKVKHLEENTAAATVRLSDEDFLSLDAQGQEAWRAQQASRR